MRRENIDQILVAPQFRRLYCSVSNLDIIHRQSVTYESGTP